MGADIGDLLERDDISMKDLDGKIVAFDAFNVIYQFVTTVRGRDGQALSDSNGNITSHLTGLLYRTASFAEAGIKPVFVFDGEPPELKAETIEKRRELRDKAHEKWKLAVEKGDAAEIYKYAQASARIDPQVIDESKMLLSMMGIPIVESPSEGEAQAAFMLGKKDVDFVSSQDYDAFIFGANSVVRNLTVSGKRKLPGKSIYVDVVPEKVDLSKNLQRLGITHEQFIDIALCVGTDFNKGLERVGAKTALKLIKEKGTVDEILRSKDKEDLIPAYHSAKAFFEHPPVTTDYVLKWEKPDADKMVEFLCRKRDFSEDRVLNAAQKLNAARSAKKKTTLDQWF
ncbi:flap endonuclease-1 [Methanolapillus millepedarum]|uniref:Flap endonuclease 1 n=1 Tax=Methanolapillus millepedarum TaxID=3028296 RepID=A0AA96V4P2_9EURY|nr:hypothetical protein MsAc7_10370 [Methanosarcinaceae archaeon Ac7]